MKLHEITGSIPLVWELAAQQIAKGKKVIFHGHVPSSSAYVIGKVTDVLSKWANVQVLGQGIKVFIFFTGDTDDLLTMRPSNDSSVADFVIVDIE